jgi:hypothetical protein
LRAKVQKVHLFQLSSVPAFATVQGTSEHIWRHVIGMLTIKLWQALNQESSESSKPTRGQDLIIAWRAQQNQQGSYYF